MAMVAIHVLPDLVKSHFIPKFLNNFDQEIWEVRKVTLVFSNELGSLPFFLFSEKLWVISTLKGSCKTHPHDYTGVDSNLQGPV